jgi:hypothetical protein
MGLRPLDNERNVQFFEEWGSKMEDYVPTPHEGISWIWTVSMQDQHEVRCSSPSIQQTTRDWESEGRLC